MNESESINVIKAFSSVTLDGLFFIQSGDRLSVNAEDFLNFNYTGNPAYIYWLSKQLNIFVTYRIINTFFPQI